ncbi:MAG: helix-turn-helix domain-containing protein [Nanoarchaeota archaeon]|nr:helix-turn-helix domain-containing protein [Nanoarchaeota archaeon]
MEKALEVFGLTNVEAKVYLELLNLGPSTAGMIAKRSGVHRRSVYDAVARLTEKGLIGYMLQNNVRYFEAVDPEKLKKLLEEKQEALDNILPKLKTKYLGGMEKQTTVFFKGKNGLKNVFEDQIKTGGEILIIGASPLAQTMMKYYFNWFDKRRVQKSIHVKLLYGENYRKKRNFKYAQIRYLPKEFQNPAAMNIYGDNVAIIHWSEERPFAVVIKEKEIADGYRNYFNLLWDIGKR